MSDYWFIQQEDGSRMGEFCYGQYNGGEEAAKKKAEELKLTVSEKRNCPYPGCPYGPTTRPPCALCYE